MTENSKCPHCGHSFSNLKLNQMPAEYRAPGMTKADSRNCWVYSCPWPACGKAISVHHASDELARLVADIVTSRLRESR